MAMLNFKYGAFANLPVSKTAGTVYVTSDEQAMYIDLPNKDNASTIDRIRIGDIIVKNSARDAKPPFSDGAFYYFVAENALLRWDSSKGENGKGAWTQVNSVSAVTDQIDELKNKVILKDGSVAMEADLKLGADDQHTHKILNVTTPVEADSKFTAANKEYVDTTVKTAKDAVLGDTSSSSDSYTVHGVRKRFDSFVEEGGAFHTLNKHVTEKLDPLTNETTGALLKTGGTMSGAIAMGNDTTKNKITYLAAPEADYDAANKKYVDEQKSIVLGTEADEATANTVYGAKKAAAEAHSAANAALPLDGSKAMTGAIAMGGNKITNLATPGVDTDAATKKYVDDAKKAVVGTSEDASTAITVYGARKKAEEALAKAENALPKAGGDMSGEINMNNNKIVGLPTELADGDTSAATSKTYVDNKIAKAIQANDAMTFKGTVGGTGATVTALPTSGVQRGDTYKVALAGTYAGVNAKVGDLFISIGSEDPSTGLSTTPEWTHVSSGYEDDYLQKLVAQDGAIYLTNGIDSTTGFQGGFKIEAAAGSNLKFSVNTSESVHTVTASLEWGTF